VLRVCICVYVCVRVCVRVWCYYNIYVYVYIYTYVYIRVCNINVCVCVYMYVYTYIYTGFERQAAQQALAAARLLKNLLLPYVAYDMYILRIYIYVDIYTYM